MSRGQMHTVLRACVCLVVVATALGFVPASLSRQAAPTKRGRATVQAVDVTGLAAETLDALNGVSPETALATAAAAASDAAAAVLSAPEAVDLSPGLNPELDLIEKAKANGLPPPYVPVVLSGLILTGIFALQASLGDVMGSEAELGMESGSAARKQAERRATSSYFRK